MIQEELRLGDFEEGFRFRIKCANGCGYQWYEKPPTLLAREDTHRNMYLYEVEELLSCARCRKQGSKITPIINTKQHHFVGGMV